MHGSASTAFLAARGARLDVVDVLADRAAGTVDAGAVADALEEALRGIPVDAVLLAQYSISPSAAALQDRLGIPVLTGPARAAARMRAALTGDDG